MACGFLLLRAAVAQPSAAAEDEKPTDAKASVDAEAAVDVKAAADLKAAPEAFETIYLSNATQPGEATDVTTAVRNMLPRARIYYVETARAIVIHGSMDDLAEAKSLVIALNKPEKVYRLTYTVTDVDGGKRLAPQHFSMVAAPGRMTTFKQGSRVPIVTGSSEEGSVGSKTQVQYLDVGFNVEATINGRDDDIKLTSKVEQTSMADEKSGMGPQDPVVRQAVLDGTSMLTQGKPLLLGSFDVPGSTRRQEIEVVAELVK